MRVKLFTFRYSATLGGFDDEPLETFLKDKSVLSFREHFFRADGAPHLACVVAYQEAAHEESNGREGKPHKDPRNELTEPERVLYETLREWRAARARQDGVPPYVVFTNRQLAAIVRARPDSATALGHVEGIGKGKLERYGEPVLALVAREAS